MRLTIRIYKRHDPDLLAFYYAAGKDFDIKTAIKTCLKNYIANNEQSFSLPDLQCEPMATLPPKVNFHIPVDREKDADIAEWLKTIKQGRRNNLIKNIFRNAYPPIPAPYYTESETQTFTLTERR